MFDFPHVERKTFSRNFLRTIIFQVSYDEMTDLTEKKSAITTIFKDKFPRVDDKITNGIQIVISNDKTPITRNIQDSKTGMSLEFKSSDGQKVLSIERSQLTYTSSNKGYTNFESLVEDLSGITEFFSLCGIDNVKKVAIRKINSIDFKVGGNPTDTLAQLISPDLLTNLYYIPNSNYIKQNIQTDIYSSASTDPLLSTSAFLISAFVILLPVEIFCAIVSIIFSVITKCLIFFFFGFSTLRRSPSLIYT